MKKTDDKIVKQLLFKTELSAKASNDSALEKSSPRHHRKNSRNGSSCRMDRHSRKTQTSFLSLTISGNKNKYNTLENSVKSQILDPSMDTVNVPNATPIAFESSTRWTPAFKEQSATEFTDCESSRYGHTVSKHMSKILKRFSVHVNTHYFDSLDSIFIIETMCSFQLANNTDGAQKENRNVAVSVLS